MNRYARPKRCCRDSRRFRICAWMERSSEETGLVADHEPGLQCQRAGDGDALLLPAGELVGKRVREPPPHADQVQQPAHFFLPFPLCAHPVDLQGVPHDSAHAHHRVQRRQRVLKDDLHLPPQRAQFPAGERAHVPSLEIHPSRGGLVQSQDRAGEGRLAAAAFSDQSEGLVPVDLKRHPVHGPHHVPALVEMHLQVHYPQQRFRHGPASECIFVLVWRSGKRFEAQKTRPILDLQPRVCSIFLARRRKVGPGTPGCKHNQGRGHPGNDVTAFTRRTDTERIVSWL